jgi:hypothetical protein
MSEILTDAEKDLVANFNLNTKMKEAVRKVLLQGIYDNGVIKIGEEHNPVQNWALSIAFDDKKTSEEKGQLLTAVAEGIRFLKTAFEKLDNYKLVKSVEPKKNKAR